MASNNPHIHYVKNGALYRHDGTLVCRVATGLTHRTGWLDWLQNPAHKSFSFIFSDKIRCTISKELRIGSTGNEHYYWFAARSIGGVKKKVSLGKSTAVTLEALIRAARELSQLALPLGQAKAEGESNGERKAGEVVPNKPPWFGTVSFKQMSFLSLFREACVR